MKRCPHCDRLLPVRMFNRNRAAYDGLQGWCRECMKDTNRGRRKTERFRQRWNATVRKRYQEDDVFREHLKAQNRLRRFGVTPEQYRALGERQGWRCAICGLDLSQAGPKGFGIDHDHRTGAVRALLCVRCNFGIGSFLERPDLCLAAAEYLLSPPKPPEVEPPTEVELDLFDNPA